MMLAGETYAAFRRNLCCLPAKPMLLAGETYAACRRNLCCLPAKPMLLAGETYAACRRNLCCFPAKPMLIDFCNRVQDFKNGKYFKVISSMFYISKTLQILELASQL